MKHELDIAVYSTGSKWCAMAKQGNLDADIAGFGTTVAAALRDLARNIEGRHKEKKIASRIALLPDEEWLESLRGNPGYEGIDVRKAFRRCCVWCEEQGVAVTRRRFLNWLNRERPMRTGKNSQVKGEHDYSQYRT